MVSHTTNRAVRFELIRSNVPGISFQFRFAEGLMMGAGARVLRGCFAILPDGTTKSVVARVQMTHQGKRIANLSGGWETCARELWGIQGADVCSPSLFPLHNSGNPLARDLVSEKGTACAHTEGCASKRRNHPWDSGSPPHTGEPQTDARTRDHKSWPIRHVAMTWPILCHQSALP